MKMRMEFEPTDECHFTAIEIEQDVSTHKGWANVLRKLSDVGDFTTEEMFSPVFDTEDADHYHFVEMLSDSARANLKEAIDHFSK